uniref:Uncharacterized protein n=1 Tax=Rhizophora mucronata TaxID=61149 RepID=A0A2P2IR59_RHIMU
MGTLISTSLSLLLATFLSPSSAARPNLMR